VNNEDRQRLHSAANMINAAILDICRLSTPGHQELFRAEMQSEVKIPLIDELQAYSSLLLGLAVREEKA
jgi:hypothetical protein